MPSRLTWQRHVDAWRSSGLSARDFAARHHLDSRSLYAWSSRLRRATEPPPLSFLPVLASTVVEPLRELEVVLSRGRRILVRPGFDPALLRAVVEALEAS